MTTQTFGNYLEASARAAGGEAKLVLGWTTATLTERWPWRTNGLSAEFLADYLSACFPAEQQGAAPGEPAPAAIDRDVHDAVNYIVNELFENAIKYSYLPAHCPVEVVVDVAPAELRVYLTNCLDRAGAGRFQAYIERLLTANPDEMYLQQMEANAQAADQPISQLGYLSIINHYPTDLAWKFAVKPEDPTVVAVTTLVRLKI